MTYMGYEVARERDHIRVTAPNGVQWTEDTMTDAKREIRAKLELMDEIELRNQQRINDYIEGLAR